MNAAADKNLPKDNSATSWYSDEMMAKHAPHELKPGQYLTEGSRIHRMMAWIKLSTPEHTR